MFLPMACFLAFFGVATPHSDVTRHSAYAPRIAKPHSITAKALMTRLSKKEIFALLGKKNFRDSSALISSDPSVVWHERVLDSVARREHRAPFRLSELTFAPISFEGMTAKVTVFFADDSSFGAVAAMPYPPKLGSEAKLADFDKLRDNIATSIGEPSVSTEAYIDYLVQGDQSLFGTIKNGTISISIWTVGH